MFDLSKRRVKKTLWTEEGPLPRDSVHLRGKKKRKVTVL